MLNTAAAAVHVMDYSSSVTAIWCPRQRVDTPPQLTKHDTTSPQPTPSQSSLHGSLGFGAGPHFRNPHGQWHPDHHAGPMSSLPAIGPRAMAEQPVLASHGAKARPRTAIYNLSGAAFCVQMLAPHRSQPPSCQAANMSAPRTVLGVLKCQGRLINHQIS